MATYLVEMKTSWETKEDDFICGSGPATMTVFGARTSHSSTKNRKIVATSEDEARKKAREDWPGWRILSIYPIVEE